MTTAFATCLASSRSIKTSEFAMHLDENGILRVHAVGLWQVDAVKRYFTALDSMMTDARRRFGRALVLVDKRDAPPQSAEVTARLHDGCLIYYKPTDRLAVVLPTSLAKLKTRRGLPNDRTSAFVSIPAAEHYLLTS